MAIQIQVIYLNKIIIEKKIFNRYTYNMTKVNIHLNRIYTIRLGIIKYILVGTYKFNFLTDLKL